jgi:hypothetical protein
MHSVLEHDGKGAYRHAAGGMPGTAATMPGHG